MYGTSPIFIGSTMIHYKKTFHTYLFFAATLIGLRREIQGFRTDGEKALGDAFAHLQLETLQERWKAIEEKCSYYTWLW